MQPKVMSVEVAAPITTSYHVAYYILRCWLRQQWLTSYKPTGDSYSPTVFGSKAAGSEQLIYSSPTRTLDSFTGSTQAEVFLAATTTTRTKIISTATVQAAPTYEPIRNSTESTKTGDEDAVASGASAANGADRSRLNALVPLVVVGFAVAVILLDEPEGSEILRGHYTASNVRFVRHS